MHGVSTRKVDKLMKALGLDGVSKSEVSHICGELDPLVDAFRTRARRRQLLLDVVYLAGAGKLPFRVSRILY